MHPQDLSFRNRADGGRQLVPRLMPYAAQHPIVLALPRGGVPVAFEVAKALRAPLDLIFVRKIGAPGHAEFGLGAVVDGAHPQVVLNEDARGHVAVPPGYIEEGNPAAAAGDQASAPALSRGPAAGRCGGPRRHRGR